MSRGRQRLAVLLAGAVAAAALGAVIGASRPPPSPSPSRPSPRSAGPPGEPRRASPGAVILLSFAGTRAPAYVERILRRHDAAGAFLGPANVTGPVQLHALTSALRRAGGPGTLIAVDQEGGAVRAAPFAGPRSLPLPGFDPASATSADRAAAVELRALGISVDLAPVVDAARPGSALASRAFPAPVASFAAAAVLGFDAGGVAATAKHFPGLGAATANTDDRPVTIPLSRDELERVDLPPFRAAIAAGVPLVMVSHAVYPALDPAAPASRSRAVVTGLLRGRLGFRGVVVTDSLEAAASLHGTSLEAAAVASVRAGVDLLLTTGRGSWIRVRRALAVAAARDPAFRIRLADAARRVNALRARVAAR